MTDTFKELRAPETRSDSGVLLPFEFAVDPSIALNGHAEALDSTTRCDTQLIFDHPKLNAMVEVWRARCGPGRLPTRSAFGLRTMKEFLPHISILDVISDPIDRRYRHRFVGTEIVRWMGEMTGAYLDDVLPPQLYKKSADYFAAIVRERCPLRIMADCELPRVSFMRTECFAMPLADNTFTPNMIMTVLYFSSRR